MKREKSIIDVNPRKIAVFRALNLGDLIVAVPALRSLRKNFPKAEITLIGLPWAAAFARRFYQYIDKFIKFPGYPGLPETAFQPRAFTQFLLQVQKKRFDLAIQMQGSGTVTNRMMVLFAAKNLVGFYSNEAYKPKDEFFVEYPESGHESERFLKLMQAIGLATDGTDLEFPVLQTEAEAAAKMLDAKRQEKAFVCIHSGSREEARKWSPCNFAKVADYVHSRGYGIIFSGTAEERGSIDEIAGMMESPSENMAGYTNLGELAEIVRRSSLLVSNDTGVAHVAAAVKAPSVIIHCKKGADLERWSPLNKQLHSVIKPHEANLNRVIAEIDLKLKAEYSQEATKENEHASAI